MSTNQSNSTLSNTSSSQQQDGNRESNHSDGRAQNNLGNIASATRVGSILDPMTPRDRTRLGLDASETPQVNGK